MEKTSTIPSWPQLEPAEGAADGDRLRLAFADIRSMAASSLDQIASLGKLGLIALERPLARPADREMLAQLLTAVVEKAQMTSDSVLFEAETVGIPYRDEAKERRAAAHCA